MYNQEHLYQAFRFGFEQGFNAGYRYGVDWAAGIAEDGDSIIEQFKDDGGVTLMDEMADAFNGGGEDLFKEAYNEGLIVDEADVEDTKSDYEQGFKDGKECVLSLIREANEAFRAGAETSEADQAIDKMLAEDETAK
ncbi:MAG: hypothetical protein II920_06260 [Clostridia bacterium]|nr:hypothetical protein [Clostridia bacterium]